MSMKQRLLRHLRTLSCKRLHTSFPHPKLSVCDAIQQAHHWALRSRQNRSRHCLRGENDVWVAGCANFYASPFGRAGSACPVPVWGCLECPNAVITSRHLPAILLFLNRMIAERERMEEGAWAALFGRAYARIVEQMLPAFPPEVVTAARAMLEASTPLFALPPNLAHFRQTL